MNVSETTYLGYKLMIDSRMAPFFRRYGDLKVREITGDEINEYYMPILLAAYFGLRRSEVLGLKWSAVDFENKTVSINHKVIENKNGLKGMDMMKTKSSYRTLSLIPQVEGALRREKDRQEEMKRVMRRRTAKSTPSTSAWTPSGNCFGRTTSAITSRCC